ncbi:MAG: zinc ribbon domain-containing protein [Burkholderiaceae bacterium]
MPTYDYRCERCGPFSTLRTIARRNDPCVCPSCGAPSARELLAAPMTALMSADARVAHATNERSAHAPYASGSGRYRHLPGCSCCSPGKRRGTLVSPGGAKSFPGSRPWQISH